MAKIIDPKKDWKANSTGGKVLYVLGGLGVASWAYNLIKQKTV